MPAARRLHPAGTHPTRFGHVDHHSIRAAVFDLYVPSWPMPLPHAQGGIHIVPRLRPGAVQLLGNLLQAVNLEANMVDARPGLAPLCAGYLVLPEVENGQID